MLSVVLMVVLALTFSPLPAELPDTRSWEVSVNEKFVRDITADVADSGLVEGWNVKFLRTRGICPEELGSACRYAVKYEFRRLVADGKMQSFIQHFLLRGPTGASEEGIGYLTWEGPRPVITVFYRKGDRWLTEEPGSEEFTTAAAFLTVLAQRYSGREPVFAEPR